MNGVSPTGVPSSASRSDASRFLSQSENDVAAAFAELLRTEGITTPSPAAPPPPATSNADRRRSSDDSSRSSESSGSASAPAPAPAASGTSGSDSDDESLDRENDRRDDTVVAVAPATAPQPAASQDDPAETEETAEVAELEALLEQTRDVQSELATQTGSNDPNATEASQAIPAAPFAETLTAAGDSAGETDEVAVDPVAESSPRIDVPSETEIVVDPQRRSGALDDEDADGGFSVEDVADDVAVDEEALAALLAKAEGGETDRRDVKSRNRDGRPSEAPAARDAAAGNLIADQAVANERIGEALVVSATFDANLAQAKTDATEVQAVGSVQAATASARREEPSGSLLRSIERGSETDRRLVAGADRSRFLDRVERAFHAAEQGDGAIRMRLHPAELGSMQLTLQRGETGEWVARIETESPEAKQALLENAGALKDRLAEQDFRLARLEVETPADRRQQDPRDFQENPQSFSRHRDRRDDEQPKERSPDAPAPSGAVGDRSRRLDVTI